MPRTGAALLQPHQPRWRCSQSFDAEVDSQIGWRCPFPFMQVRHLLNPPFASLPRIGPYRQVAQPFSHGLRCPLANRSAPLAYHPLRLSARTHAPKAALSAAIPHGMRRHNPRLKGHDGCATRAPCLLALDPLGLDLRPNFLVGSEPMAEPVKKPTKDPRPAIPPDTGKKSGGSNPSRKPRR
jgi:hypothetical protein